MFGTPRYTVDGMKLDFAYLAVKRISRKGKTTNLYRVQKRIAVFGTSRLTPEIPASPLFSRT